MRGWKLGDSCFVVLPGSFYNAEDTRKALEKEKPFQWHTTEITLTPAITDRIMRIFNDENDDEDEESPTKRRRSARVRARATRERVRDNRAKILNKKATVFVCENAREEERAVIFTCHTYPGYFRLRPGNYGFFLPSHDTHDADMRILLGEPDN